MLNFFAKQFKYERKYQEDFGLQKKNRSVTKSKEKSKKKFREMSADKLKEIRKKERVEEKLMEIEEVEKS